jgi:hypothetical protein
MGSAPGVVKVGGAGCNAGRGGLSCRIYQTVRQPPRTANRIGLAPGLVYLLDAPRVRVRRDRSSERDIFGTSPMGLLTVQVWDATGNKRQDVSMPDDAPINRILVVLLEKMSFPQYAPDGQILSYKFHHRASGKQLLDPQTLTDAGVKDGDVLRLQPEITAG